MAHAEATVVVSRPFHEVFQFLADGQNNKLWRPSITDVNLKFGKPGAVGTIYKQGLKDPKGRRIDADYQITEIRQNEEIIFQVIAGPMKPKGKLSLASLSDGTRIRYALDFEPKGFAKIIEMMEGNVNKFLQAEVLQIGNLKKLLEQPETALV